MRTATNIRTPTATHFHWIVTFGTNNWFGTVKMHVNILTTMENRSINVFVHLIRSVTSLVLVMTIWLDIHHSGITLVMCSFIIWFRRRFIHSIAYMPEGKSIVFFFFSFWLLADLYLSTSTLYERLILFCAVYEVLPLLPLLSANLLTPIGLRIFYFISFFFIKYKIYNGIHFYSIWFIHLPSLACPEARRLLSNDKSDNNKSSEISLTKLAPPPNIT